MPASTYPFVTGDPILRTCRHCRSRVAQPAMCLTHTRTCMTCCSSRLKRDCAYRALDGTKLPTIEEMSGSIKYFPDMTWEERQADKAQLNRDLGFRPYTEAELAQDAEWRKE